MLLLAMTGKSGSQYIKLSVHEMSEHAMVLADYQVDFANLALTKDNFGLDAVSQNEEGMLSKRKRSWYGAVLYYVIGIRWLTICMYFLLLLNFWAGWVSTKKSCKIPFLIEMSFLC